MLKLSEGLAGAIATMMREGANRNWRTKLGALLFKSALFELRRRMDYTEYGGAPVGSCPGMRHLHGASNAKAIKNAIGVAKGSCVPRRDADYRTHGTGAVVTEI